jgi:hypothetical protein
MAVTPWIQEQVNAAEALIGAIVLRWNAVEMAIRETGPTGDSAFTDPSVPCLQLFSLTLDLVGDARARIGIYQNDDVFGLSVSRDEPALVQQGVWDLPAADARRVADWTGRPCPAIPRRGQWRPGRDRDHRRWIACSPDRR